MSLSIRDAVFRLGGVARKRERSRVPVVPHVLTIVLCQAYPGVIGFTKRVCTFCGQQEKVL
jgi:hypothetical protein